MFNVIVPLKFTPVVSGSRVYEKFRVSTDNSTNSISCLFFHSYKIPFADEQVDGNAYSVA